MVINIGELKSKDYKAVYDDIRQVVEASKPHKVESHFGNIKSLITMKSDCLCIIKIAGAAFVKTSTGFGKRRRYC